MIVEKKLKEAKNISDIFDIVKKVVRDTLKMDTAGLMLGMSDLGIIQGGVLGAYYSPASNMIVVNRSLLKEIRKKSPQTFKAYLFHILLHEYIHSVGVYDENQARVLAYEISNRYFGKNHVVTRLAQNWGEYLKNTLDTTSFVQGEDNLDFVLEFNKSDLNYIG